MIRNEMWHRKLTDPSVIKEDPNKKISRGSATFWAYLKLSLLPSNMCEDEFVEYYDSIYDDWKKENGDIGEMYIVPPISENFAPVDLYRMFCRSYLNTSTDSEPTGIWRDYKLSEYGLPKKNTVRVMPADPEDVDHLDSIESSLFFCGQDVLEQRTNSEVMMAEFNAAHSNLEINYLDIVSYILLGAICTELYGYALDQTCSKTRFVGMPAIKPDTISESHYIPLARWDFDELIFGRCVFYPGNPFSEYLSRYSGVRFSVGERAG